MDDEPEVPERSITISPLLGGGRSLVERASPPKRRGRKSTMIGALAVAGVAGLATAGVWINPKGIFAKSAARSTPEIEAPATVTRIDDASTHSQPTSIKRHIGAETPQSAAAGKPSKKPSTELATHRMPVEKAPPKLNLTPMPPPIAKSAAEVPKRAALPPPPSFDFSQQPPVKKRPPEPIVKVAPPPVRKSIAVDPFDDPGRFRAVPPPPRAQPKPTEVVARPPRLSVPPRGDFPPSPVVLNRRVPPPPVAQLAVEEMEPLALAKRKCPVNESFERVSRDFAAPKADVVLDVNCRAQAPVIRRLELVAPAPVMRPDPRPSPPKVVVETKPLPPPQQLTPVVALASRPVLRPERVELRSVALLRKVGSPMLLVARVADGAGQPLGGVLVEWTIDRRGVGHVVSVPDTARGADAVAEIPKSEKLLPTFARSTTTGKAYYLDASEADGKSIEIKPGEACCYVNSPIAGDMAVVAIVPNINRADRRESGLRVHWTNAKAKFPKDVRVVSGSDADLVTQVLNGDDDRPLPGYTVRYRVAPIETQVANAIGWQSEVATDADGRAVLKRNRTIRGSGSDRVEIELLGANTLQGDNAVVLAKGECKIDWYEPKLALTVEPPAVARVGEWLPLNIRLENRDDVAVDGIRVEADAALPIEFDSMQSSATSRSIRELGSLGAGKADAWRLAVRSREVGKSTIRLVVRDARGPRGAVNVAVEFAAAKLSVAKPPAVALVVGQKCEHSVVVRNTGAVVARTVEVEDDLPDAVVAEVVDGLRLMDRMLWRVGDLQPGESRKLVARWTAKRPVDPVALRARALQEGAGPADAYGKLVVRGCPALSVEIVDAIDPIEVGRPLQLTVRIRNRGTAAAENITMAGIVPPQFSFVDSTGSLAARHAEGRLRFDAIARLEPGESIEGILQVRAVRAGEARTSIRLFHEAVGPDGIETQESTSVFVPAGT